MKKSDIPFTSEAFSRYVDQAYDIDLLSALRKAKDAIHEIPFNDLNALENTAYAENKWTVKEIFQHMMDAERVFAYRALRFARFDQTPLPGFEENDYAKNADVAHRNMKNLFDEFLLLRDSTIFLFSSFTDKMLIAEGMASERKVTVLTLGYSIVGHQLHHYKILKERYLPLLK